jgi:chemotaxis protein CheD
MPFGGDSPIVRLNAGEAYFSPKPHRIATLLGSCVAVCVWDPQRRMGGMTHSLIPSIREPSIQNPLLATDRAIVSLIDRMVAAGSHAAHLQAKLFGGFSPLASSDSASIGADNVRTAITVLEHYRIAIVAQEILGEGGIMIYMDTETGQIQARRIAPMSRVAPEPAH